MLLQTLKGFRDFLPKEAKKRQYVIDTLKRVCEHYGFEPLETPSLEYAEILSGKYGEEGDKLMYQFTDNGDRKVALRYDQTVPTARVVAQYANILPFPFKRYQIQPVWRAENTQKGRYREFIQCDFDTFGVSTVVSDAEIIATTVAAYSSLGFKKLTILMNDRTVFEGLSLKAITAIDKLKKIGKDGVCAELVERKLAADVSEAATILQSITEKQPSENLRAIMHLLPQFGIDLQRIQFSPTLARGLDYYTGLIFEVVCDEYTVGSLGGGGRFDNLVGMFSQKQIPAVGMAIGFDRTIEAMEALQLFPQQLRFSPTKVLVTVFSQDSLTNALTTTSYLRNHGINTDVYLGDIKENNPLEKQLKYANQKQIPYCIIAGPEEIQQKTLILKNMQTRQQKTVSQHDIIREMQ